MKLQASLGSKLTAATLLVLAVVSSFVFYGLTARARDELLASKSKAATLVVDLFVASAVAPLDFGDDKDVQDALENLRIDRDIVSAAVWREGASAPTAAIGSSAELPDAAAALARAPVRADGEALDLARRIERPDGSALGVAVVRFSLAPERAQLRTQRERILGGTAATAALIAALILGFARFQIVAPLERLVAAARRVQGGEAGVRVETSSGDEVGRLADAFNTMSEAIREREQRLASAMSRLRELFDNMRQAIVVFGRDGLVEEAPSAQATVIFGASVAGRSIRELLYADVPEWSPARQAFEQWLDCAFDVPASEWAAVAELAPAEARCRGAGEERWLELQFTPVVTEGRVERIMMLGTDVTEQRRLEQAAQTLEQQHARQMGLMRRLLAGGGQVFVSFLDGAQARLSSAVARCAEGTPSGDALVQMLEIVHTIRGEARTFELEELAAECQGLERSLRDAREDDSDAGEGRLGDLAARLGRALSLVSAARDRFVEASPIGAAVLDQMTVRRSDVRAMGQLLFSSNGAPSSALVEELRRRLLALEARPFGECVAALEAAASRWADAIGKKVALAVTGRAARVPARVAPVLTAVLPHLVRNAIAHGIEPPSRRRGAGKPDAGTVSITATEDPEQLTVVVRDDGAGVDAEAVTARARELGIDGDATDDLLFAAGLSTARQLGELAGHGVGLSAVRSALREAGCDVRLSSSAAAERSAAMEGHVGAAFVISVPWTVDRARRHD
ncbi:MAG TPA: HAMP domain-containing protein [Polyangiaceae bacterium]|nr:HAMP domain-containing protein [Polyangiaceae bacterium]